MNAKELKDFRALYNKKLVETDSFFEEFGKLDDMEAIKIGVIGGGSITYPNARFALKTLEEFLEQTHL